MHRKIVLAAVITFCLFVVSLANGQEIKKSAVAAGKKGSTTKAVLLKAAPDSAMPKTQEEAKKAKLEALKLKNSESPEIIEKTEHAAKRAKIIAEINKLPVAERKKALREAWKNTFVKEKAEKTEKIVK